MVIINLNVYRVSVRRLKRRHLMLQRSEYICHVMYVRSFFSLNVINYSRK